ncbi:MAG: dienelactone hydrolase family protein [Microbacteriaceae bacterium]|nr:dienelactone hydrolase family protein [Microbacteriaceae bacterium]
MNTDITEWVASNDFDERQPSEPVTLLLHGYGSHEQDLPPILEWLGLSTPWVSPRAPIALPTAGFAWAPITIPGNPDPDDAAVATDGLWRWLDQNVPVAPIVAIGFSQGGFMVSQLLRTRPDRIAKAALLAGFVAGTAQPADPELVATKPTVFWAHGTSDTVIVPEAIERTSEFLHAHTTVIDKSYPGLGHSIDERVLNDLRDYLASA